MPEINVSFSQLVITIEYYNKIIRHFIYKKGRVNSNSRIISADEDPSLRIESSAIINLRSVSTKLNKYNKIMLMNL